MKSTYPPLLGLLLLLISSGSALQAQLLVDVDPPLVKGNKLIVKVRLENLLSQPISSMRAFLFVLDQDGKLIAEQARWVIHPTDKKSIQSMESKEKRVYHWVLPAGSATPATVRLGVTRVFLEDGSALNPEKPNQVVVRGAGM